MAVASARAWIYRLWLLDRDKDLMKRWWLVMYKSWIFY
jgi:hypothetical protein